MTERRDFADGVKVFRRRTVFGGLSGTTSPWPLLRRSPASGPAKVCLPPCCIATRFMSHVQKMRLTAGFSCAMLLFALQNAGSVGGLCRPTGETNDARQALDLPDLRGSFDRARFERAVSQESGQGTDRAFGRLRSADPDRLRLRSRAGARRGRQGRRAGQPSRRHARAVRRHPARHHEHVDDHQRHRGVADGALHRGRRRTGRAARRRCKARSRTTSSRNICRAAPTCFRRRRRCG